MRTINRREAQDAKFDASLHGHKLNIPVERIGGPPKEREVSDEKNARFSAAVKAGLESGIQEAEEQRIKDLRR